MFASLFFLLLYFQKLFKKKKEGEIKKVMRERIGGRGIKNRQNKRKTRDNDGRD